MFHVHTGLLAQSNYFNNALIHRKNNADLRLDKDIGKNDLDIADTFAMYVHFLYFGTVPCKLVEEPEVPDLPCVHEEQESLMRLYILAQGIEDGFAMDAAMSSMLAVCGKPYIDLTGAGRDLSLPSDDVVEMAYANTPIKSPMRRLMVDMHVWSGEASYLHDDLPPLFVADVGRAALDKLRDIGVDYHDHAAKTTCCNYHQHQKDMVCSSRKRKREVGEDDDSEEDEEEVAEDDSRTTDEGQDEDGE